MNYSTPSKATRRHGRGQGSRDLYHQNGLRAFSNEGIAPRFTHRRSCVTLPYDSPTLTVPQTPIVSLASTQSILLSHQVYLTDRIDNKKRERMAHMKCVCLLQNSEESLAALEAELREPKYGEYYLCQWVNANPFRHVCDPHCSSLLPQTSAIS